VRKFASGIAFFFLRVGEPPETENKSCDRGASKGEEVFEGYVKKTTKEGFAPIRSVSSFLFEGHGARKGGLAAVAI
jgi:hypothetical protein